MRVGEVWKFTSDQGPYYKFFRVVIKKITETKVIVDLYDHKFHEDLSDNDIYNAEREHVWEGWENPEVVHDISKTYFLDNYEKDYSVPE